MNLAQILKEKLNDRNYRIITGSYSDASVMILLTEESSPKIYFVKRSLRVPSHPGEISLPGGMQGRLDRSLLDTAYRETYEEINISKNNIRFIGRLGHHLNSSGIRITPYIGVVGTQIQPSCTKSYEVEQILTPTIQELMSQKYVDKPSMKLNDNQVTDYFTYNEHYIWGVTGRIICEFFNKCFGKSFPIVFKPGQFGSYSDLFQ